ncbi:hypothetical protein CHUAL_007606 [Chamberlinius hualienensis]
MVENIWLVILPGIILSTFLIAIEPCDYDFVRKGIRIKDNVLNLSAEFMNFKIWTGCNKNICTSKTCRHNSKCALNQQMSKYKCFCAFPSSGRRCEYLGPSTRDYKTNIQYNNKTMFMLIPHYNSTVYDAHSYCTEKRMHLATFQNKCTLEFVAKKLKEFFSADIHKNYRFALWIGLNQTNTSDGWHWTDVNKTELSYTDKWAPNRPTNNTNYKFASIRHDESLQYLIHDEPFGGEAGWVHLPLCEYYMNWYDENVSIIALPDSLKNLI